MALAFSGALWSAPSTAAPLTAVPAAVPATVPATVHSHPARHMQRFFAAPPAASVFPGLTPREHEVLELVARGRSNPQIARALGVSGKTVRNHVSNLFTKLQVADRAQAIVRARSAGLGAESPAPATTG